MKITVETNAADVLFYQPIFGLKPISYFHHKKIRLILVLYIFQFPLSIEQLIFFGSDQEMGFSTDMKFPNLVFIYFTINNKFLIFSKRKEKQPKKSKFLWIMVGFFVWKIFKITFLLELMKKSWNFIRKKPWNALRNFMVMKIPLHSWKSAANFYSPALWIIV